MRIHSILSPKCLVRASDIGGQGVFAAEPIKRREVVAVWGGKVRTTLEISELKRSVPHIESHAVAVCEDHFLTSENVSDFDDTELFNHSCDPNIGIQGQIVLIARRDIRVGEELTFDYGTTETTEQPWRCRCGTQLCRGVVDGRDWRDPVFIERNRDFLSWYILERLRRENGPIAAS